MNSDPELTTVIGEALANVIVWAFALAAVIFAAFSQPIVTAVWFPIGYAAYRVSRDPAPGIRVQLFMAILVSAWLVAFAMRSSGPLAWFVAGWCAYAATVDPRKN